MKRFFLPTAAFICAAAVMTTGINAQELEGIEVQASRIEKSEARRTGISKEYLLQASYHVSYGDLDLTTDAGRTQLKERVETAADLACTEIERAYPLSTPDHLTCARKAAKKAMENFRPLVAGR